jgi:hypothetical protein
VSVAQGFRPPATQRQYDACVIGSQVGGAVAAALLAKRGFRVLEVEHDGRGAGYADAGRLLPWRPALFPSPRSMPAAESVLDATGGAPLVARHLHPLAGGLQLLLPRARLELAADRALAAAELRREWPGDAPALEALLAELDALFEDGDRFLAEAPALPPRGLVARLALRRALARARGPRRPPLARAAPLAPLAHHPLAASLGALAPFLCALDGPPGPLAAARLLGAAARGLHAAEGGAHGVREIFRRHGAAGRADHDEAAALRGVVEALELHRGRVQGIRLAGTEDPHAARAVIVATDAAGFARLLPPDAPRRAMAALSRLRPTRRILAVNFVVRDAAIPPPLGAAALLALGGEGEAVLVQRTPARARGGEPIAGEQVLCAAMAVPAEPWTHEALHAAAGRIRGALAEAVPFFDRHLLHESIPPIVAGGEGEPVPDAADPLFAPPEGSVLGATGLPSAGALPNVFLAGRDVLPGLGLEGEIYAGIQAAAHAVAALGGRERKAP